MTKIQVIRKLLKLLYKYSVIPKCYYTFDEANFLNFVHKLLRKGNK